MATTEAHRRALAELHQLRRELIEQRYLRRADGLERAAEAVRRLGELGSPGAVIARSAGELGESSDFDRVLISRVDGQELLPLAAWASAEDSEGEARLGELCAAAIPLGYPLIEDEVARRRGALLVAVAENGSRALARVAGALEAETYVVVAIVLAGKSIGLVHASRAAGPAVDELDLEVAMRFADGLGRAFERAVLREKLQRQRDQLESAARWIGARMLDSPSEEPAAAADALQDLLTARELEVLRLISGGLSNRAIAAELMLREGTVKYHVKNILRKLQARSRAEAVSRYLQLLSATESA